MRTIKYRGKGVYDDLCGLEIYCITMTKCG